METAGSKQCLIDQYIWKKKKIWDEEERNIFMHGFWWMPREMNAEEQGKSNQKHNDMRWFFAGQFFHYFFSLAWFSIRNQKKEHEKRTAIKGVNKRNILCVLSPIIIFNNVLLQLPIFYQTFNIHQPARMFYSFHINNKKC